MSDKLSDFPEYASQVLLRLEEGARQYGDKSFGRPAPEILGELEQEVLDVLGWGYVLWQRMRKLRGELASYERMRQLLDSREETIVEMQAEIDRLKENQLTPEDELEVVRDRRVAKNVLARVTVVPKREHNPDPEELTPEGDLFAGDGPLCGLPPIPVSPPGHPRRNR